VWCLLDLETTFHTGFSVSKKKMKESYNEIRFHILFVDIATRNGMPSLLRSSYNIRKRHTINASPWESTSLYWYLASLCFHFFLDWCNSLWANIHCRYTAWKYNLPFSHFINNFVLSTTIIITRITMSLLPRRWLYMQQS